MMLWSYFGVKIKGANEKREDIETVERGGKSGRDKRGIISKFHKLDSNTHLLHELSTVIQYVGTCGQTTVPCSD